MPCSTNNCPTRDAGSAGASRSRVFTATERFVHLHLHTPYSFLDGASDIEVLVRRAAELGMPALAMTDHNSLAGAVKFTSLCRGYTIKPILGAELTMEDGSHLTLIARDREGYSNVCRLITAGYEEGGRLEPRLSWSALPDRVEGVICLSGCRNGLVSSLVRQRRYDEAREAAVRLKEWFGENGYIELQDDFTPDSLRVARELAQLADEAGMPVVATNNIHYAAEEDALGHEVLRCVATHTTVSEPHSGRPLNCERRLKSADEMATLFAWRPDAAANTLRIAESCEDSLPRPEDVTPKYPVPGGHEDAPGYLRYLTYRGAQKRYAGGVGRQLPGRVKRRIDQELEIIIRLGYADYFLMVWRVVLWARRQGIRCTGRGSAADSCVAYCLYLTDVDVLLSDLPFSRFLCEGKMPDIDMDFPSDRRDEVFEQIKQSYGEENVAMACVFSTYRAKSAVRDVGKALGLPSEALEWFTDHLSHFMSAAKLRESFDTAAELKPFATMRERFDTLFDVCARIANFPRHIGTHSSGIVISRVPLDTLAPLQGSAKGLVRIMHLDKDDAEEAGLIKFDVLALRILSAVSDAEVSIKQRKPEFDYDRIPLNDQRVFTMFRQGGGVGTFQFESPAQINLALRMWISSIEDLTAAVALIRPGPVRGDAVQRFVRTRNGADRPEYLHPSLYPILKHTYGVVIFQEQVAGVFAAMMGISEAEGDKVRKSLTKHNKNGTMEQMREEFIRRTLQCHRDMTEMRADRIFGWLSSWSGYGFTEGHGHSFALTGYKTGALLLDHPAEYLAGMMSHQPMGFYPNNSLAAEARRRGLRIRGIDINASEDKCHAEDAETIRLGLRLVSGLREEDIANILAARATRPFASFLDFCARVTVHRDRLENLILCGAFDSLHSHRRGLLWRMEETLQLASTWRALHDPRQSHFDYEPPENCVTPVAWDIDDLTAWDKLLWEWRISGVTAEAHAMAYLREALEKQNILTAIEAQKRIGQRVTAAGLNIRPHRPPTKSGEPILFTSLEDETDFLQLTVVGEAIWSTTPVFLLHPAVIVRGVIRKQGRGSYMEVEKAKPLRMDEIMGKEFVATPPTQRTYPGTNIRVRTETESGERVLTSV